MCVFRLVPMHVHNACRCVSMCVDACRCASMSTRVVACRCISPCDHCHPSSHTLSQTYTVHTHKKAKCTKPPRRGVILSHVVISMRVCRCVRYRSLFARVLTEMDLGARVMAAGYNGLIFNVKPSSTCGESQ